MPRARSSAKGYQRARELRHSTTPAESILWSRLRGNQLGGVSFRRQHAIGPFVVDFCAPRFRLVIELDGSVHHEQQDYDAQRSDYLASQGYRVLRFWDGAVQSDPDRVLRSILAALRLIEVPSGTSS